MGLGKISHLSLAAKPLVDAWGIYIPPLLALPQRGEISNPFFSMVKDWVNSFVLALIKMAPRKTYMQ